MAKGRLASASVCLGTRPSGFPVGLRPLAHCFLLAFYPLKAEAPQEPGDTAAYLRLDPVEAPEPEDLAPAQFPLGMVYLFFALGQLLIGHLIFPRPMSGFLQALELAGGDGGDDLWKPQSRERQQADVAMRAGSAGVSERLEAPPPTNRLRPGVSGHPWACRPLFPKPPLLAGR